MLDSITNKKERETQKEVYITPLMEGAYINKRKRMENSLQYHSNIIEVYGDCITL
jgi:hypothetical protein